MQLNEFATGMVQFEMVKLNIQIKQEEQARYQEQRQRDKLVAELESLGSRSTTLRFELDAKRNDIDVIDDKIRSINKRIELLSQQYAQFEQELSKS